MTGIEEEPISVQHKKNGYFLPASLVNKIMVSIVGSIFVVGAYMIGWAYNDVQWKTEQEQKFDRLEDQLRNTDSKISLLPPAWLTGEVSLHRQQIRELQNDVTKLKTEHASGMNGGK